MEGTISISFGIVVGLEVVATILTASLSFFLKTDPTRSFVLSLLVPITWLTIADLVRMAHIVSKFKSNELTMWTNAFQIVWNNCVVLTFLIGSIVFLLTSAVVVAKKQVPRTWPWYIVIVLVSLIISIAEYFESFMYEIPRFVLHGSFVISSICSIFLMISIPIYLHYRVVSSTANTTDQAVFNAKWRLFWAYLYMIIPSIRSIFVIIRAIIALDPNTKLKDDPTFSYIADFVDLYGSLLYLIPVYFFLPAYRSCLFFCYRSREMNPHFLFIKVSNVRKEKSRRFSFNPKVQPSAKTEEVNISPLQDISLDDVVENHRQRPPTDISQGNSSTSATPPSPQRFIPTDPVAMMHHTLPPIANLPIRDKDLPPISRLPLPPIGHILPSPPPLHTIRHHIPDRTPNISGGAIFNTTAERRRMSVVNVII